MNRAAVCRWDLDLSQDGDRELPRPDQAEGEHSVKQPSYPSVIGGKADIPRVPLMHYRASLCFRHDRCPQL